jgi:hypothetical protein
MYLAASGAGVSAPGINVILGCGLESMMKEIGELICINVSFESQQMAEEGQGTDVGETQRVDEGGKMNVYVINPKQSGFADTAAMTVDVLRNPKSTVVALIEADGDPLTEEERKELIDVKQLFENQGARVFDSLNDMSAYVNGKIQEGETEDDGTPAAGEGEGEPAPEVDKGDEATDGEEGEPSDSEKASEEEGKKPAEEEEEEAGGEEGSEEEEQSSDDDFDV